LLKNTMLRFSVQACKFVAVLWLCTHALAGFAVTVDGLFEVTLEVADESSEVRNAAMADGLAEILVRVSGDSQLLQKLIPPSAGGYVKQYRYLSLQEVTANRVGNSGGNAPTPRLWLQYNATEVMDFLRTKALPIWGDQRALGVIWLAVRDGSNQYLLKAGDVSAIKQRVDALFVQRGVPAVWPNYDKSERREVNFADIWGGFNEPLRKASARYSNGPVIAANMAWNGREWNSDWSLLDDRGNGRWSVRGKDYAQVLAGGINQLIDTMGKQYAVLESQHGERTVTALLEIDNVKSLAEFARVQKYLGGLQAVDTVKLVEIGSDRARFSLALRSQIESFISLLDTSSQLRAIVQAPLPPPLTTPAPQSAVVSPPAAALPSAATVESATAGDGAVPAALLAAAPKVYRYRLVN
jgi:hypothetical protein